MAYYEVTAHPKGMLEKMMGNDGLRAPYSNNGTGPGSFLPMNLPVFHHHKPLPSTVMPSALTAGSAAEVTRRGMPSFVTSPMTLNGTHAPIANGGSGNLGMMPLQISGDFGPAQQADELIEKGKRSKGDGSRTSRGGGTSSRKRTRAAQADSLTTSEIMPDITLSSGAEAVGARTIPANGTRMPENGNGDKAEKATGKRQGGQGAKRGDKKQLQAVAVPASEVLVHGPVEANVPPVGPASGILDVYGLQTRALDVSRLMVDISLDDLLSGNYEVPTFSSIDNRETKVEVGDNSERRINQILSSILSGSPASESPYTRTGEISGNSKNLKDKAVLDLERPLHAEKEDGVSKTGNADKEVGIEAASASIIEVNAEKEAAVHSVPGSSGQPPHSGFSIDFLPLQSVESFARRLNLPSSDPLLSLIARVGTDGETSGSADERAGGDVVDSCHRNGSIPPSPFSYPHVGPVKLENARYPHRTWIRHPPPEKSGAKGSSGLNVKEGFSGVEEGGPSSPSSRRRKLDNDKDSLQLPDALPSRTGAASSLISSQSGTSAFPSTPADPHVEVPRLVDNTLGTSTEGSVKPMQVDVGRAETASTPASGVDVEPDRGVVEGDGGGFKPVELPATLATPQQANSSADRPVKTASGELKQENTEHQATLKDECNEESNTIPVSSKQDAPSSQPALDVGGSIRVSCPPQSDTSGCLHSPTVQDAARALCMLSSANWTAEEERLVREKEKRRRYQPYPGAPVQRAAKSIRVSSSGGGQAADGAGGRDGRKHADGASVPPSRSLVSERRKSLSQVNDATERPSHTSPRNPGTTVVASSSRGTSHTGARSNSLSIKLEKVTPRETAKESTTGAKEMIGKGSASVPPVSHGAPPLKNSHKGLKSNSYVHTTTNSKGNVAAPNFAKVPTGCPSQRVVNGGASVRGSRTVHNGNSLATHGQTSSPPFKPSRQSNADSRQKTKSELSGRGGKPSRE